MSIMYNKINMDNDSQYYLLNILVGKNNRYVHFKTMFIKIYEQKKNEVRALAPQLVLLITI